MISKYEIQAASKAAHFEQEYRVMAAANKKLDAEIKTLSQRVVKLNGENERLVAENVAALKEIKAANADFNDERQHLKAENERLMGDSA